MNTKKMTASLVGVMLIATVLVMAASAAGMDRSEYADMPRMVYEFDAATDTGIYVNYYDTTDNVTVRIYGEEDAIYPTQSYTGADDFIYPDPVDPFDPGVIAKDSATFNPAYMANVVSRNDGASFYDEEKVFFRVFYEPGYDHPIDELMDNTDPYDTDLEDVYMPDGALVPETTYMLVQNGNYRPITGAAGPGVNYYGLTQFMLPVRSPTPAAATQPGMEQSDTVGLYLAENGGIVTNGTIEVGLRVRLYLNGPEERFMDHNVTFEGCGASYAKFMISYIGNENDWMPEPLPDPTLVPKNDGSTWGDPVYVTRYNEPSPDTDAEHRWFIRVVDVECNQYCDVVIGRHLVAGETFYVDGVRYDMPAIYVTGDDKFKYITLQSPLPKCYDADCVYWDDFSHVSCQWLTMLPEDMDVWMLPPFNEQHTMIDDIGLPKTSCIGGVEVDEDGVIYGTVDALEFHYTKEDAEGRFDSSLAERHAYDGSAEIWNWWSVFTKPYHYVELVLPNDEGYCGYDGYEYLITTSFIAPNSEADERGELCKPYDTHDIIDRAATIANAGDDSRDDYLGMPRMVFEYNAVDTEDLFVNDNGIDPTVRVYGETGATYPTHTLLEEVDGKAKDFIYPDAVDPFDPGVIAKDSVTFNSAYLDGVYVRKDSVTFEWLTDTIKVDGANADEKVFMRLFYEPGYTHAPDSIMSEFYVNSLESVIMPLGALVEETTYMLLSDSGLPKLGGIGGTHYTRFMMPVRSSNVSDDIPGMDEGDMVKLVYAEEGDIVTNGTIDVEYRVTLAISDTASFMDHNVTVVSIDCDDDKATLDVGYFGNMYFYHSESASDNCILEAGEMVYFDRNNQQNETTNPESNPAYRWYVELVDVSADHLSIELNIGRRLVAGETFYVDGVRYDMPAIYVANEGGMDKFKYITLQSPIPKCPVLWDPPLNMRDWSHVTSQWLANLDEGMTVWVLPPFNELHTMIDDIDLPKTSCTGGVEVVDVGGVIDCVPVGALEFHYVEEAIEDRFDSSLAERHAYDGSAEIWNWWSVFTKPYQYTELWLPDQEVDGNEYLITTSFIAPNCEGAVRDMVDEPFCKPYDTHDIIDRVATLLGDAPEPDKPDLVITAVTCGDNFIGYTVENVGSADAGAQTVGLYIDGGSSPVGTDSVASLAHGASYTGCINYAYTSMITANVCADINDAVDESNEGNNCMEVTCDGSSPDKPDLVITAVTCGDNFIGYTVENVGSADAGAQTVGLYIDGGSSSVGTDSVASLAHGASYTGCITYAYTSTITANVCADINDAVDESNEGNNCMEVTCDGSSPDKPDLVITAVTCGDNFIGYTVENVGSADAGAQTVGLYIDGGSSSVGTDSVASLAHGASYTGCITYAYTSTITANVCADINDAVDESNEGNNCMEMTCDPDWNPWDDDCVITNEEISLAEYHWATSTPINGHLVTNSEISILEYQWATGGAC